MQRPLDYGQVYRSNLVYYWTVIKYQVALYILQCYGFTLENVFVPSEENKTY